MGKDLPHQESNESMPPAHNPGCMKGILHHFQNHKKLNVKKRLPYKKHSTGKHNTVIADEETSTKSTPETAEIGETSESVQKNSDVQVENKVMEPSISRKSSMKSKIKALILVSDEMSKKKKGRHQRTASCPVKTQLDPANPTHDVEPSGLELPDENHSNNEEHSRSKSSLDVCATSVNTDNLKHSTGKLPAMDHTVLQNEYVYAMEPSKRASLEESKLFLDALDLLNMRQEVFLKIVKDPSSSLAHQLQSKRNSKSRLGLTKSISFPAIRSEERRDSITKNGVEENNQQTNSTEQIEPSEDAPGNMLRKRRDNKIALKRFKNIREKIKHVIKDKKKEKNMIVMDGVLHKIPYGRRSSSKDIKPDKADKFSKCDPKSNFASDDCSKKSYKRTSSFNDSIGKYDRLLETGNNRDTKDQNSEERVKFKTSTPIYSRAVLERILSLPDLRSHSYYQIDDSSSTSSLAESTCASTRRLREKILGGVGSESKKQLCSHSQKGSQENIEDVSESMNDSTDSKTEETASHNELSFEPEQVPVPNSSRLEIILENECDQQEEVLDMSTLEDGSPPPIQPDSESCVDSVSTVDTETLETQIKQFYSDLQDMKHKSEYNYVKDVLELSGFTQNEILGQWHSTNHPLDPNVFDEVYDCHVNEDDGSCDYLLLFDLINEVLLIIYEKSFCYWPMPLTCQSRMHRMPKGYHVLGEVWGDISLFLSWRPENDHSIDDAVVKDLGNGDGWMNLQFDAECVGLELEDLIFDQLLQEIIYV